MEEFLLLYLILIVILVISEWVWQKWTIKKMEEEHEFYRRIHRCNKIAERQGITWMT